MRLIDLPSELIIRILRNIESDTLKEVYRFLLQEPSIPKSFLNLLLDIYHSRVIITNKWWLRLQTIPRALKIRSVEELSTWAHFSVSDLDRISSDLAGASNLFNETKKIIFAIGIEENDHSPLWLIHKYEDAFRKLEQRSDLSQHVKGFYFYMPKQHDSQYEVTELYRKVYTVLRKYKFFADNLEEIKFHGSWCMKSETLRDDVFDFTQFRSLKKLHMNNCCLVRLSQLLLPDCVVDLDLSDNLMTSFVDFIVPSRLKCLDLSRNRFEGYFRMELPQTLTSLNLSCNDLALGTKLPTSLRVVDVSHNSTKMNLMSFYPSTLETIYFDRVQLHLMEEEARMLWRARKVQMVEGQLRPSLNVTHRPSTLLYNIQIRL